MLEIKKIKKVYKTEGFEQKALDDVNVNFRKCEFAAILGPSGSGKTTFLNIIGGLDSYDAGDLKINEVSTKKYNDRDWDSYRNHRVGFIFQSYNLITHQNILRNVELALTLSGCSKEERKQRAIKALKDVGLGEHIYKKPNQLSGGQMQRVAIARALINDPEIILADEPTGALDSDTSEQIMKILKDISKEKLVIMVTHNPELADIYATRIINIKDGKIISDSNPYDGEKNTKETKELKNIRNKKTRMSFLTALSLSFNNLMTKKGRTILIALASSIGIIGIALILAVSTGFQNYINTIQEDTLTSYPLIIMQEQADITGMLLSMTENSGVQNENNEIVEKQYINTMLSNVSANDLKSFKKYINDNYEKIEEDLTNIMYSYSVDPNIYTIDATNKLAKVNPSNLFSSMMGSNNLMNSYSNMASIFSQIVDKQEEIKKDYNLLAGNWPSNYDEMIIILSEPNSISDLLVYSLGLRDTSELTSMINSIMGGDAVNIEHEPLKFTYDDLMKVDLRLIMPSAHYQYNAKYKIYEDMSQDEKYMQNLYDNALKLKIVGVVCPKEDKSTSTMNRGVAYTSGLIDYIIEYASKSEIVQKQLENPEIDVFSGKRFDSKKSDTKMEFKDLIKVDNAKLQSAFNGKIDQKKLEKSIESTLKKLRESITFDNKTAEKAFSDTLKSLSYDLFKYLNGEFNSDELDSIIDGFVNSKSELIKKLETKYLIETDTLKKVYTGLLKGLLISYTISYNTYMNSLNENYTASNIVKIDDELKETVISNYLDNNAIKAVIESIGYTLAVTVTRKTLLDKIGNLTDELSYAVASSFKIDQNKIASAFKLNITEKQLTRIINALMNMEETNQNANLITLGYQDREDPTYISFYFTSFDGKEHFLSFIDDYNKSVDKDSEINFTDTTGILMSSVKTIVNAVSYVLIAFVSISLVVSSIMIGVITYISVYERTKEIGILRAIGASKRNISSIFNAETFIIGLLSGLFGIGITYIFIPIINAILHHYTGNIPIAAVLEIKNALLLVGLAIILTIIGGLIPAKSASLKDPVIALRSE